MFFKASTRLIHTVWNANRDEEFLEHQGEVCVRECEYMVLGPSCFFTMYAGIRPLCTSIWYNSSLDDASMILHLTSVFIEILHF